MKKLFVLFLFLILFGIVGCQSSDNVNNELPNTNDPNENEITDDKPLDQDETDKDESNNPNDNVAHFAHLGGMIFGFILIMYWKKKNNDHGTYYN